MIYRNCVNVTPTYPSAVSVWIIAPSFSHVGTCNLPYVGVFILSCRSLICSTVSGWKTKWPAGQICALLCNEHHTHPFTQTIRSTCPWWAKPKATILVHMQLLSHVSNLVHQSFWRERERTVATTGVNPLGKRALTSARPHNLQHCAGTVPSVVKLSMS